MTVDPEDSLSVKTSNPELLPIALAVGGRIQGTRWCKSLIVLFDTGSTSSWMNAKSLPKGIRGYTVPKIQGSTLAGTFESSEQVCVEDLVLPEYSTKKALGKLGLKVFNADCRYDMILGRDALRALGIDLNFETNTISTGGVQRDMREYPRSEEMSTVDVLLQEHLNNVEFKDDDDDSTIASSDDVWRDVG